MKPSAFTLFVILIFTAALKSNGANPSKDDARALHREQVADFITRVAYARANADPAIYGDKSGGTLSCIVYTVKHGPGGAPGYTVVIATDKSYAPMDDLVAVSDTVEIDPAHSIKCSGHVFYSQSGWITAGGDGMTLTLGLGKKDRVLKIAGPRKTVPI